MYRKRVKAVLPLIFWLVIWQLAAMAVNKRIILVTPLQTLSRLSELIFEGSFYKAVISSTLKIGCGFFGGLFGGIILACAAFVLPFVKRLLSPLMSAVKAVPVASFVILALFWMSSRYLSVFISLLMVLPIIYFNVLEGLSSADGKLIEMAQVFRMRRSTVVRYIYFPAVIPYLRSACTAALGLCWKSGIAAEVIGQPDGSVGDMLYRAKIYLETEDLFAWTVVIIILSKIFEMIFLRLLDLLCRLMRRVHTSVKPNINVRKEREL